MAKARLVAAEPQLFVKDLTVSCAFYTGKLGFEIAFIYGEPAFYGQVVRGGARLNLRSLDESPMEPARRDSEQLLAATITVEAVELLFAEYRANGVEFLHELRTEPWDARTFIVRDLDGNLILFSGR